MSSTCKGTLILPSAAVRLESRSHHASTDFPLENSRLGLVMVCRSAESVTIKKAKTLMSADNSIRLCLSPRNWSLINDGITKMLVSK